MCGIIGYSGKDPIEPSDFKILMLYSQQRGDDASGFATSKILTKDDSPSSYLIAKHKIPETNLIIGHTRNPSRGHTSNKENAQPFRYDKIVGAHNGFLSNHWELKNKTNATTNMSDSYYGFLYMNNFGVEEALKTFEGGYALIWINLEDQTLNVYRKTNPIFNGQKDGNIFIASQKDYLEAIDCVNIDAVSEYNWITIKDGVVQRTKEIQPKPLVSHRKTRSTTQYDDRKSPFEKETKTVGPIKIDSIHGPKNADFQWFKGNKHYYWIDESDVLNIEVIYSHKNSKVHTFNLSLQPAIKEAYKLFKPIIQKVLEENDD